MATQKKKKATAASRARNRAQSQQHLSKPPPVRSNKQADQGRFPGETPLTGEDRPVDRPGHKQRGFEQDLNPRAKRRTPVAPAEQALRRARGVGRSSPSPE